MHNSTNISKGGLQSLSIGIWFHLSSHVKYGCIMPYIFSTLFRTDVSYWGGAFHAAGISIQK